MKLDVAAKIALATLVVTICACIGTWLALTPIFLSSQPSNLTPTIIAVGNTAVTPPMLPKTTWTVWATASATANASPTPSRVPLTATPTLPPTPSTPCPPNIKCFQVALSSFDPNVWCKIPTKGYSFDQGKTVVTASNNATFDFHPCENLSWNVHFVELRVTITQFGGRPGNAVTGLNVALSGDRYAAFALDSAGNAYVEHAPGGQSGKTDGVIPLGKIGEPHTLRIEWTGQEAVFLIDGKETGVRIPSDGYSTWFLLFTTAYPNASVVSTWDSVSWGISP